MNERIDRIADQIMAEFHDVFGHGDVVVPDEFFERFAELIVGECAQVANDSNQSKNRAPGVSVGDVVRKHFGVEE